jgi:hypothetical protein
VLVADSFNTVMANESRFSRAPTIHQMNDSSYDPDSEAGNVEFATYTVHIPLTPDNQPAAISVEPSTSRNVKNRHASMERSASLRLEDQFASSSMFTGGYNCFTRAQLKEKVIETDSSHPQMASARGSTCEVPGCNGKVITDERGLDILPCPCEFKICRDCLRDTFVTSDGMCPGCGRSYKGHDETDFSFAPEPDNGASKMERRLSMMKSQTNGVEVEDWLFEPERDYGYGNAMRPKDARNEDQGWIDFKDKPQGKLTRKLNISTLVLSPYR